MWLSRWLFCSFSDAGTGKIDLPEVPHLPAGFPQLLGTGGSCDVRLGAGSVYGVGELMDHADEPAAASAVLRLPWF